eukprot:6212783-Pleurochrysis_carterae.AAC.5
MVLRQCGRAAPTQGSAPRYAGVRADSGDEEGGGPGGNVGWVDLRCAPSGNVSRLRRPTPTALASGLHRVHPLSRPGGPRAHQLYTHLEHNKRRGPREGWGAGAEGLGPRRLTPNLSDEATFSPRMSAGAAR